MPRGAGEVADVFRRYGDAYRQQHGCSLSTAQRRVMTAIEQCRTAALGGHVVSTVPQQIAAIAHYNKGPVYDILCHAAAETLRTIAADPKHLGGELGFFTVLHTWGQTLLHHPHLHCVVAGGGLSAEPAPAEAGGSRWIACRPTFFLPIRVLARLFRRLFLASLEKAFDTKKLTFYGPLQPLCDRRAFQRHL